MVIPAPRVLHQEADQRLSRAPWDPRRLILIHSAAGLGLSFLITLLNFLISQQIGSTSGLSGLSTRAMLETAQSVLQLASTLVLPFWEFGLIYAALCWARQEQAVPASLLEGFRRFGPILRLLLLQGVMLVVLALVCIYLSSSIFMITPFARPMMELLAPVMEASSALDPQIVLDEATVAAMMEHMTPVLILFVILYLVVSVPLLFRLRFARYFIMDGQSSAIAALIGSWNLTKGHVLSLLKLDLSYWLFYALQAVSLLIGYGDQIFPALGLTLSVSPELAFFGFYLIHIAAQLAIFRFFGPQVFTGYALAYDTLGAPSEPAAQPITTPRQPWTY